MNLKATDIHQTLNYVREPRRSLTIALPVLCLGLYGVLYGFGSETEQIVLAWGLLAAGLVGSAYAFIGPLFPKQPLLVLSPEGILYTIGWANQVFIPWHEIHGIDTIDITAWNTHSAVR